MTTETAVEKELTQKQERFCVEYYRTGDKRQSAVSASYSLKSASVIPSLNLAKPEIQERIRQLREQEEKEAIADVQERKGKLTQVYRKPLPTKVSAREQVMAITEHNRMDGSYPAERAPVKVEVVRSFIFVLPDGTRVKPKELMRGSSDTGNGD